MARPIAHLLLSTGVATVQWIRTGRLGPTLAPYLTGFLIDADHLADLARYKYYGGKTQGKIYLPLHGWEYLALLVVVERLLGRRLAGGLLLGYLSHLALDQLTNATTHPLTYSLSFRWRRGFSSNLFSHRDEADVGWMQGGLLELWRFFF